MASYGRKLKQEIFATTGLTASVGIAPNKFLAKFASEYKKPDGFMLLRQAEAEGILEPLPVAALPGIGKVAAALLRTYGVNTVGDFKQTDRKVLEKVTGRQTDSFLLLARGLDERPVVPLREAKSIGRENTYPQDLRTAGEVRKELFLLAQKVGWRLRSQNLCGFSLCLKVRYPSFETVSRSVSSATGFYYDEDVYQAALELCGKISLAKGVRLLSLTASRLERTDGHIGGLDFDGQAALKEKRTAAVDSLKKRFGETIILRGLTPGSKEDF
jgi:DNA polymerase-4